MADIYTNVLIFFLLCYLMLGPLMFVGLFIGERLVAKYPQSKFTSWWRRNICAPESEFYNS